MLLTTGGADPDGLWQRLAGQRVVAKVADFGLSLVLPEDRTHASFTARVSLVCLQPLLHFIVPHSG